MTDFADRKMPSLARKPVASEPSTSILNYTFGSGCSLPKESKVTVSTSIVDSLAAKLSSAMAPLFMLD
jgi:hypothetical protein